MSSAISFNLDQSKILSSDERSVENIAINGELTVSHFHGLYSPTIHRNILCLFLQDFVNLNVTQLLIGSTVWFSQSEVVLHSNTARYRKIWRRRQRTFLRMVGEYGHCFFNLYQTILGLNNQHLLLFPQCCLSCQ